jgi:hypothetical protein
VFVGVEGGEMQADRDKRLNIRTGLIKWNSFVAEE